jgi:hypothetical protein
MCLLYVMPFAVTLPNFSLLPKLGQPIGAVGIAATLLSIPAELSASVSGHLLCGKLHSAALVRMLHTYLFRNTILFL